MRLYAPKEPVELSVSLQRLHESVGGQDEIEGSTEMKTRHVTDRYLDPGRGDPSLPQLRPANCKHGLRGVHTVDIPAVLRQREEHTAGTAAEL
jgi:hypothetical protein